MNRMQEIGLQTLPAAVIATVWQLVVSNKPEYEFFIGSPAGILREFRFLLLEEDLLFDFWITMIEAILGFLSGSILGILIGLSMWGSATVYVIAKPYLIALGSIPVFALGPVLIFWFGTGIWSKVVLGFLATFSLAVVQAYTGAIEADKKLLAVVRAFGGTKSQEFFKIVVPSAMIWVLSAIRLNIGMALLGAFIGEFISSRMGLGHMIIVAEGLYNVNQIWVGCICIVMIAIMFHACTHPIERWAQRWK